MEFKREHNNHEVSGFKKHSFEWELIKKLIRCNERLSTTIFFLLLLWFVTIYFLVK